MEKAERQSPVGEAKYNLMFKKQTRHNKLQGNHLHPAWWDAYSDKSNSILVATGYSEDSHNVPPRINRFLDDEMRV